MADTSLILWVPLVLILILSSGVLFTIYFSFLFFKYQGILDEDSLYFHILIPISQFICTAFIGSFMLLTVFLFYFGVLTSYRFIRYRAPDFFRKSISPSNAEPAGGPPHAPLSTSEAQDFDLPPFSPTFPAAFSHLAGIFPYSAFLLGPRPGAEKPPHQQWKQLLLERQMLQPEPGPQPWRYGTDPRPSRGPPLPGPRITGPHSHPHNNFPINIFPTAPNGWLTLHQRIDLFFAFLLYTLPFTIYEMVTSIRFLDVTHKIGGILRFVFILAGFLLNYVGGIVWWTGKWLLVAGGVPLWSVPGVVDMRREVMDE